MSKLKEIKSLMETSYFTVVIPNMPYSRKKESLEFLNAKKAAEDAFLLQKEKYTEMKNMVVEAYSEVYQEISKESLSVIYNHAQKNASSQGKLFYEFEKIADMYIEINGAN